MSNNWIPFLKGDKIDKGDDAQPSLLSRIIMFLPLRWAILVVVALLVAFWSYIWIKPFDPEANLRGCDEYRSSTAHAWREHELNADKADSYYVIIASFVALRNFPALNQAYAELEAYRLRKRFPKIDVDVMATAHYDGSNKMPAIVLARGESEKARACQIRDLANACGIAENKNAYIFRLRAERPEGCP